MEEKYIAVKWPLTHTFLDFPDPLSFSLMIFLVGCDNNCSGCQNPELQSIEDDIEGQLLIHPNTLIRFIEKEIKDEKQIESIVLSGGDPLFGNNLYFTQQLCKEFQNKIPICIYTGSEVSKVKKMNIEGFKYIKCGRYDESLKQKSYKNDYEMQLASSNQEWYNSKLEKISEKGLLKFY